jgi:hypothetical protein
MSEDSEIRRKAAIIEGMVRRRQWSMSYKTVEDTVSRLPNREKKKAIDIIDELVNQGWMEYHKAGECVSLRSSERSEIREFLEEYSYMEDWMLDSLF